MNNALGLIEVKGLVAMIDIADAMAKVSAIKIEKTERAKGFGWMTICISGDVAAVDAAIQAGKVVASENNWFISAKVIPRPANGLLDLFKKAEKQKATIQTVQEESVKEIFDNEKNSESEIEPKIETKKEASTSKNKIEKEDSTKKVTTKKKTKKLKNK